MVAPFPPVKSPSAIRAILLLGLALSACAPKTQTAQFYLLQPLVAAAADSSDASQRPIIGVGPVEIPAYLDRPQIVSADGAQLHLAEFHRWAEPLRDTVTRVMAANLSALLPASHLLAFPWNRQIAPAYQIEIKLARLHMDAAGNAELIAQWSLLQQAKPVLLQTYQTQIPANGSDYNAKVAAQSQALAAFSRRIAAVLHERLAQAQPF